MMKILVRCAISLHWWIAMSAWSAVSGSTTAVVATRTIRVYRDSNALHVEEEEANNTHLSRLLKQCQIQLQRMIQISVVG